MHDGILPDNFYAMFICTLFFHLPTNCTAMYQTLQLYLKSHCKYGNKVYVVIVYNDVHVFMLYKYTLNVFMYYQWWLFITCFVVVNFLCLLSSCLV